MIFQEFGLRLRDTERDIRNLIPSFDLNLMKIHNKDN